MAFTHIPSTPSHAGRGLAHAVRPIVPVQNAFFVLLAAMMVLVLFPALAVPMAAADERPTSLETPRAYDIPAGPLNRVLNQFARTSGLFLSGAAALTQGRDSPGLQGRYTPLEALDELLGDAGLDYRLTEAGTLTVVRDRAGTDANGPVALEPLVVSATRRATPVSELTRSVTVVSPRGSSITSSR